MHVLPLMLPTITFIELLIRRAGFACALVLLPGLMIARITEITTRYLNTPGSLYNAIERELFLLFAFLIIGMAAVNGAHVRVDILRDRMGPKTRAWVDLVGFGIFILPFSAIVLWYGAIMVWNTFVAGEPSALSLGGPTRWIVAAATPIGIGLFLAAFACRAARQIAFLRGNPEDPG